MKTAWIIVVALALFCCFELRAVDATKCEPFSSFKVDCNTCFCGKDGSRYACTRKLCKGEPEYLNEEEFKERNFDDDSYNVVFLNDEMPSSNEVFEERKEEGEEYPVPPLVREDPRFDRSFQDVDLDEQEAEYVNAPPDNYRYRKDIFY